MEINTIDIILIGAVVSLVGKMVYDIIRAGGAKSKNSLSVIAFDKMCISVQETLKAVTEMDKRFFVMEKQLDHSVVIAEKNSESYQKFIIAVNDLSNINKNVLAETRAQTEILTKMLLNGRSKSNA